MKQFYFSVFISIISFNSISQVTFWSSELKKIKAKGAICKLTGPYLDQTDQEKIVIPSLTAVGIILPYIFKYTNSAIKQATSIDEKDYNATYTSLNQIFIPKTALKDSIPFNISLEYYTQKNTTPIEACNYQFKLSYSNQSLVFDLSSIKESAIPIKCKNKYDFVIESFEFNAQAIIQSKVKKDSTEFKSLTIKKLGSTTIKRVLSSYKNSKEIFKNQGSILLPLYTEKGDSIDIKSIQITVEIKYVNPYGMTKNSLNTFLENNSDTNEELLNTIFIKPEED